MRRTAKVEQAVMETVMETMFRLSQRLEVAGGGLPDFGFCPDAMQSDVISSGAKRLMLCCTRQWGKSTTAAALVARRAIEEEGALVLCVAPTLRQSGELIRKVMGMVAAAGVAWKGGKLSGVLPNGSRIVALPGHEANVRGFSAPSLIVIDEAARVSDALYASIRPMLVVGDGDLALLSTPFGERGFFWKEWTAGGEGWKRISVKATECERIAVHVLEEERRTHSAEWFAQEYLCSFVGMENQAFQSAWLEAALVEGLQVKSLQFQMKGGTL